MRPGEKSVYTFLEFLFGAPHKANAGIPITHPRGREAAPPVSAPVLAQTLRREGRSVSGFPPSSLRLGDTCALTDDGQLPNRVEATLHVIVLQLINKHGDGVQVLRDCARGRRENTTAKGRLGSLALLTHPPYQMCSRSQRWHYVIMTPLF